MHNVPILVLYAKIYSAQLFKETIQSLMEIKL